MGAVLVPAGWVTSVPHAIAGLFLQPEGQWEFYQQLQWKQASRQCFASPTLRIFTWFTTHCSDSCLIYSLFTSKSTPLKLMFSLKLQHVLIVLIILEIALSALLSVAILLTCCPGSTLLPCSLGVAVEQVHSRGGGQEAEGSRGGCPWAVHPYFKGCAKVLLAAVLFSRDSFGGVWASPLHPICPGGGITQQFGVVNMV